MMVRPIQRKTRGQIESEISEAITKFEKEHMGRGPLETRTFLVEDMVIVRLKGILTKAEHALVKSDKNFRARELVKQVRIELIESGRSILEDIIKAIIRRKVKTIHSDISTISGEKMIVFILDRPPDL